MSAASRVLAAGADLAAAIHAEWLKLRSARFTWIAVLASVLLAVAACAVIGLSVAASSANGYDIVASAPQTAADAFAFAQLPLVIVAMLVTTGEYTGGAIRLTLRATPQRGRVLAAKSVTAAAFGFVSGAVLAVIATLVAAVTLGDAAVDATTGEAARTTFGAGGYLALVSVLAVAVGTLLRGTLMSILVLAVLLLAAPTLAEFGNTEWLATARDYLPSTAGAALTSPSGGYGADLALAVLGVWALASQLVAYAAFWARDA